MNKNTEKFKLLLAYRILFIGVLVIITNVSYSQDAKEILHKSYQSLKNNSAYDAKYTIMYKSEIDTGIVYQEDIRFQTLNENILVSSKSFKNISNSNSKVYINHDTKHVTYIPELLENDSIVAIPDFLSFYFPKASDNVSIETLEGNYLITIKLSDRNIKQIEYNINKKTFITNSISLYGQVHPILKGDINAQMTVELLDFKAGKEVNYKNNIFLISTYIKKYSGSYSLVNLPGYSLDIIQ